MLFAFCGCAECLLVKYGTLYRCAILDQQTLRASTESEQHCTCFPQRDYISELVIDVGACDARETASVFETSRTVYIKEPIDECTLLDRQEGHSSIVNQIPSK